MRQGQARQEGETSAGQVSVHTHRPGWPSEDCHTHSHIHSPGEAAAAEGTRVSLSRWEGRHAKPRTPTAARPAPRVTLPAPRGLCWTHGRQAPVVRGAVLCTHLSGVLRHGVIDSDRWRGTTPAAATRGGARLCSAPRQPAAWPRGCPRGDVREGRIIPGAPPIKDQSLCQVFSTLPAAPGGRNVYD